MKAIKNIAEFADKKFGQNFLKNNSYIHRIVQAMPSGKRHVVEIGPGLGDLTTELVKVRDVTAFEIDNRLCHHLHDQFVADIESNRLKLVCDDAMKHWEDGGLSSEPYDLVANLPYYIATRFVIRALHDPLCVSILVLVQKEVALKFAASAGEREFSALSVMAKSAGEAKVLFDIPPEAFVPAPKVMSAILSIEKANNLKEVEFEEFLKVAFRQPRKKLSKNLEQRYDKNKILGAWETLGLKSTARPHEVETSTYHHLYNILKKDPKDGKRESRANKKQHANNHSTKTQP